METIGEESQVEWLDRPVWPYALGAVGGLVLAVGAFIVVAAHVREVDAGRAILGFMGIGSAMLAVAWARVAKQGFRTVGPFFGCLALIGGLALVIMPTSFEEQRAVGLALAYSFVVFAASHLFVTGLVYVRIFAALGVLPSSVLAVAATFSMRISAVAVEGLLIATFAVFALLGLALALELPALRRRADLKTG